MERRKAEESREVREHLQRHISRWESLKEELSLLQRGKELQDNELHRLRKGDSGFFLCRHLWHACLTARLDNESLRHEKDQTNERMHELLQTSESAKSTVELQDMSKLPFP
jgi:hypothetical protein